MMPENTTTAPEGFVTSEELTARGISADAQRRGRHGGDLPFAQVGADRYAYKKADVETWLAGEVETAKTSRRAIEKYAATKRAAAGRQDVPTGSAKTAWKQAVAAYRARGMSPDQAIHAVDKAQPGLRERMLAEVNHR